jgi:hypothetical protein
MAQTITYNGLQNLLAIYSASSGGTVYSANLANSTAFNFFPNNAVVNDALYFGMTSPQVYFGDLQITVGTALAAASITLVWEYYNGSAWVSAGVTDNTNSFRTVGTNTVVFPRPPDAGWYTNTPVAGNTGLYLRARITAVSGITNGGANATNKVQCRDLAITISNPGATTTGFCAALYSASQAGGWGVVQQNSSRAYAFDCHIKVGLYTDSAITTISDASVAIVIAGIFWAQKSQSIIQLGTLVDAVNHVTTSGCSLIGTRAISKNFADGGGSEAWNVFSSLLSYTPYSVTKSYNTICNQSAFHGTNTDIYNVLYTSTPDFTGHSEDTSAIVNGITCADATNGIRAEFRDYIRGMHIQRATYMCYVGSGGTNNDYDNVYIDAVVPNTTVNYTKTPTDSGGIGMKVGMQYSMKLKVVDATSTPIQSASITLTDAEGLPSAFAENGRATAMSNTATAFSPTGTWSVGDYVRVGNENMLITGGTAGNYVVSRAQRGTQARTSTACTVQKLLPVILTDASGSSGELLIETQNTKWVSGTGPGVSSTQYRNPFQLTVVKYGYIAYSSSVSLSAPVVSTIGLLVDPVIVKTMANAALITGIAIDYVLGTITVTGDVSVHDLYDYVHWNAVQGSNAMMGVPLSSTDGVNFALTYDLILSNAQLTGSGAINMPANTLTLVGTGGSALTIMHNAGVLTAIKLSGMVAGTRIQLWDVAGSVELYNGVPGTTLNFPITWTTNKSIRIRAMYADATTAKIFYEATATLYSTGLNLAINQVTDTVYAANTVNGAIVTGIIISDTLMLIEVAGGSITWAQIYAYETYWLTTAAGITDFARIIDAVDSANYILTSFKIKNISSPSTPLVITGGYGRDSVTGLAGTLIDNTGGTIFCSPDNVISVKPNLTLNQFLALK